MKNQSKKNANKARAFDRKSGGYVCDDCIALGFCRLTLRNFENNWKLSKVAYRKWKEQITMTDTEIQNLIPVKADFVAGKFTRQHYQVAFDAFHQQDYETAFLHFKAVEECITNQDGVYLGIAACLYFLKRYTQAIDYAYKRSALYNSSGIPYSLEKFIAHCENSQVRMERELALAEAKKKEEEAKREQQENELIEKLAEHKLAELLTECAKVDCKGNEELVAVRITEPQRSHYSSKILSDKSLQPDPHSTIARH